MDPYYWWHHRPAAHHRPPAQEVKIKNPNCWRCGRWMCQPYRLCEVFRCNRCQVEINFKPSACLEPFNPAKHVDHSAHHVPSPA